MFDDDAYASALSPSASPQCSAIADEPAPPSEDEGSDARSQISYSVSSDGSSCARRMRDAYYYCGNYNMHHRHTSDTSHAPPATGSHTVTDDDDRHDADKSSSPSTLAPPAREVDTSISSASGATSRPDAGTSGDMTEDVLRHLQALRTLLQRSVVLHMPRSASHEDYADAQRCTWSVPRPPASPPRRPHMSPHLP